MTRTVVYAGDEYLALLAEGWTVVKQYWLGVLPLAVLVND